MKTYSGSRHDSIFQISFYNKPKPGKDTIPTNWNYLVFIYSAHIDARDPRESVARVIIAMEPWPESSNNKTKKAKSLKEVTKFYVPFATVTSTFVCTRQTPKNIGLFCHFWYLDKSGKPSHVVEVKATDFQYLTCKIGRPKVSIDMLQWNHVTPPCCCFQHWRYHTATFQCKMPGSKETKKTKDPPMLTISNKDTRCTNGPVNALALKHQTRLGTIKEGAFKFLSWNILIKYSFPCQFPCSFQTPNPLGERSGAWPCAFSPCSTWTTTSHSDWWNGWRSSGSRNTTRSSSTSSTFTPISPG